jgi:Ca2+-binding RTX toxin-like protein
MAFNSDFFDLSPSKWKITLPVDSSGKISGTAVEIKNLVGYEHSSYFYDAPDKSMVFRAMADGATTSGSKYARTELREMNGSDRAAWKLSQGGTMTATLKVDSVPSRSDGEPGRLIVGQIHGADKELVRLYYEGGKMYFMNDQAGPKNTETKFTFKNASGQEPNISLGEKFSYMIDAEGSKLTVKIFADGQEYTSISTINSVWQSDTFYFKAGVYLGVNETQGSGWGQTSFYGLDFSHTDGQGLGGWKTGLGGTTPDIPTPPKTDNTGGTVTPPITPPQPPVTDQTTINGDARNNILTGGKGNDTLWGRGGDDVLNGGDGNDYLWGNEGNDTLIGGAGADTLKGGAGMDTYVIRNKGAIDTVVDFSVANKDKLDLSELLKGALGFKHATALKDGYVHLAQKGAHVEVSIDLDGAAGPGQREHVATLLDNTVSKLGASSFILPGDTGTTTPPPVVTPPTSGSTGSLTISGNSADNVLKGGNGNDVIRGQGGDDTLIGGDGRDELWGNDGDDVLIGGHGADILKGGTGMDTFVFNSLQDAGDIIMDFRKGEQIDISGLVDSMLSDSDVTASQLIQQGYLSLHRISSTQVDIHVDADGSAGAGQGILLASLSTEAGQTVDHTIFVI